MRVTIAAAAAALLAPLANAAEIEVGYSDAFAETLEDDYGAREGEYLTREVIEDIEREFEKAGVDPARVEVTILDAKPNRPTFKQLGDRPGLDLARSISIGGMALSATAYTDAGETIATLEHDWFENDIRDVRGAATWSDAHRASNMFARKLAKAVKE